MTDIINLNDNLPLPPQPATSSPALTATLVQDEQHRLLASTSAASRSG
jgi:hypothetical protein